MIDSDTEDKSFRDIFIEKANTLPDEWEHEFELSITETFDSVDAPIAKKVCWDILGDRNLSDNVRYAAFCALHLHYRHMSDHEDLNSLCEQYEGDFFEEDHPSLLHFELLKNVDVGLGVKREHLEKAKRSVDNMHETSGAQNLLADLIATYYENADVDRDDEEAISELNEGLAAVQKAIDADPTYAKYYAIRARLKALLGNFEGAKKDIHRALSKEDSKRSDYALRCTKYESIKNRIDANELRAKLDEKMTANVSQLDERIRRLNDSATNNLEFLGLFAGIISFTIGGISIASNASEFSFLGAAGLLIVLMGAELIVFSGFSIVLHGFTNKGRFKNPVLLIMGIGILMIIAGAMMCGGVLG